MGREGDINEIPGLAGYGVTPEGVVYCCRPVNGKGSGYTTWRPVKPLPCGSGRYRQVGINRKKYLVHRLVALVFLGPCPEGHEVSHKNGVSTDNAISNLEYSTHAYNESLKVYHGTSARGENNPRAKLTLAEVAEIREAPKIRGHARGLAIRFRVSEATISKIKNGRSW